MCSPVETNMNAYLTIALIVLAGGLALVAARVAWNLVAEPVDGPRHTWRTALWAALQSFFLPSHYDSQLGGYVHDTAMSQWISPGMCSYVTGTWTDAVGAVTGTVVKEKTAADSTGVVYIPIAPLQSSVAQFGSYLTSIDIWWATTTAALDAAGAIANIDRFVLPANG